MQTIFFGTGIGLIWAEDTAPTFVVNQHILLQHGVGRLDRLYTDAEGRDRHERLWRHSPPSGAATFDLWRIADIPDGIYRVRCPQVRGHDHEIHVQFRAGELWNCFDSRHAAWAVARHRERERAAVAT